MLHDRATIQANHDRFIARVIESEQVWALKGPTGYAYCESNDFECNDADASDPSDEANQPKAVLVFWSDRAYAARAQKTEFQDHEVVDITLFDFLFRWLSGIERDGGLVGLNWTADLAGLEADPGAVSNQILDSLGPARVKQYADRLKNLQAVLDKKKRPDQ
jgi:hypothetical protein